LQSALHTKIDTDDIYFTQLLTSVKEINTMVSLTNEMVLINCLLQYIVIKDEFVSLL